MRVHPGVVFLAWWVALPQESQRPCRGCRIDLQPIVAFGAIGGDGEIDSDPSAIARDSRGRYFVVLPWSRSHEVPLVFGPTGEFVARIGRTGSGPNEYRQPTAVIVGPGDSIYVFDQRLARLTVLSSNVGYVRSATVLEAQNVVRLTSGEWIIRSEVGPPESVRLSATGGRIGSVRDSLESCTGFLPCSMRRQRLLAAGPNGGFWSARAYFRLELVHRDARGALRRRLQPDTDRFAPYDAVIPPAPGVELQARVVGLWADSTTVWVVGNTADQNWRRAVADLKPLQVPDRHAVYDGVIEARDATTGELIARYRGPEAFAGVIAPGEVFSVHLNDDGFRQVRVYGVARTN